MRRKLRRINQRRPVSSQAASTLPSANSAATVRCTPACTFSREQAGDKKGAGAFFWRNAQEDKVGAGAHFSRMAWDKMAAGGHFSENATVSAGRGNEGGLREFTREFNLPRTTVQEALDLGKLDPAAKEQADTAGLT